MRKSLGNPEDVVATALVEAVVAARWESAEILSRRRSEAAAELLRSHSAELANSAFARDQLLKLALEAAASDIEAGRSPLEQGALFYQSRGAPDPQERDRLRRLVEGLAAMPPDAWERLVPEFERRQSSASITDEQLCKQLNEEAQLHEAVWDDPRLLAEPTVRLMMLRSVAGFRDRAAQLNPSRVFAQAKAERRRAATAYPIRRTTARADLGQRIARMAAALLRGSGLSGLWGGPSQGAEDQSR